MNGIEALEFIAERGVEVIMTRKNTYVVNGFYKSGHVIVDLEANTITARYGEVTEVPDSSNLLEQLVWLNEYWWEYSRGRYDGWVEMNGAWSQVKADYESRNSR